MSDACGRVLYCHCANAKVVPPATKAAVLEGLNHARVEFEAVPDLCEMAARGDARLREFAKAPGLTVSRGGRRQTRSPRRNRRRNSRRQLAGSRGFR
jgi:hypothetical protein